MLTHTTFFYLFYCFQRCTKHTDEGLVYISGEKALLIPKSDGTEDLVLDPNGKKQTILFKTFKLIVIIYD